MEGDRLVNTPYDIKFREDVETYVLCTKKLTGNDLFNIRMAIAEDYYFQVRSSLEALTQHGAVACNSRSSRVIPRTAGAQRRWQHSSCIRP